MGTEQAKPLSGGETLLFSLLPPPFGAIDPTFVCKIFEIFENILEPSTLLRVCLQNICDIWNIQKFFRAINPTFVIKIFAIFEIFENTDRPRSACVCKTLTVSPHPHRLELVAWINGGRPTTSADETGFRTFEEFENIWNIWMNSRELRQLTRPPQSGEMPARIKLNWTTSTLRIQFHT